MMCFRIVVCLWTTAWLAVVVVAQDIEVLKKSLTFHASFDQGFDADFSKGSKSCLAKKGKELVPVVANDEIVVSPNAGRFGSGLHFTKKGTTRPQFKDNGILKFNKSNWSASVSVWLRLDPDKDLEPGYCDPVQIIGEDSKKGFIFMEWSKDESPRFFRFAIRPMIEIWNPTNVPWDTIPFDKRPMVQVEKAPFSRDAWTHAVFSFENINAIDKRPIGRLHLNGELRGTIQDWDLRLGWDPAQVWLVIGASYVGHMDDLAVFDRALNEAEIQQLYRLKDGVRDLRF